MLEQILRYVNNWFLVSSYHGTFHIESGSITLPFLIPGQYFRIIGSVFNDGLYRYQGRGDLTDETFDGTVWALAIPQAVVDLAEEIGAWEEKNGEAVASPFVSESFGGYSYTKKSGASDGNASCGWQGAFSDRLRMWRKI